MEDKIEKIRVQNRQNLMEIANSLVNDTETELSEAEQELADFLIGSIDENDLKELQDKLKAVFGKTIKLTTPSKFYFGNVEGITPKTGKGKVIFLEEGGDIFILGKQDGEIGIHHPYNAEIKSKIPATAEQIAEFLSYLSPFGLEAVLTGNFSNM
jgi:hypothetical protein